jgi:acyl dehydratase
MNGGLRKSDARQTTAADIVIAAQLTMDKKGIKKPATNRS